MKKLLLVSALALCAATVQAKDIVDTAVAAGSFKTLATALTAAGLIDTLTGKGPFAVFAPTTVWSTSSTVSSCQSEARRRLAAAWGAKANCHAFVALLPQARRRCRQTIAP